MRLLLVGGRQFALSLLVTLIFFANSRITNHYRVSMKKALALVVASSLILGMALAQDVQPVVKAGSKSINFTFGGLGTFGLTGAGVRGGISGSYFLTQESAVRIGLQVYSNSTTTPWNDLTANGTNPGSDGSTSAFAFGIGADYLMYINATTPRVRPYLGAGVRFITQSSDTKPAVATSAPNGALTETKNGTAGDGLTFGVAAIIGAEFFIYSAISLSAEYQLNLFSVTSNSDMVTSIKGAPSSVTTKQGSSTSILGFGAAGATLHIYF
jgi:hypothetical protein